MYYHRADSQGIGFDRSASGSNAVGQYAPQVAEIYGDSARVPESLLLWFHHVPWDRRMRSGRTLWEELVGRYSSVYYHRADSQGIGFDRSASGSNAVGQYAPQVA
ncbi:hypothetical protein C7E12_19140, partial [Stenotrophomonas maltophilia]